MHSKPFSRLSILCYWRCKVHPYTHCNTHPHTTQILFIFSLTIFVINICKMKRIAQKYRVAGGCDERSPLLIVLPMLFQSMHLAGSQSILHRFGRWWKKSGAINCSRRTQASWACERKCAPIQARAPHQTPNHSQ